MGITRFVDNRNVAHEWVPIRSGETCPICGSKKGRCARFVNVETNIVEMIRCKNAESSHPSNGWYLHFMNNSSESTAIKVDLKEYKSREIKDEDIVLWDKVYRSLKKAMKKLKGHYLYPDHRQNLLDRGLNDQEIENMGFFSVPNDEKIVYDGYTCKLTTAIVKELAKEFAEQDLLKVPGFKLGKSNGKTYVYMKNKIYDMKNKEYKTIDGFFIPYYSKGLLAGMQYRLSNTVLDENDKVIRYRWYASKDVSCGSPIDYYIPMEVSYNDIILVTEGALKAKYAASKMKMRSLGEAGVSNYRNLIKNLQMIEKSENKKYKILLALDADKYSNEEVIKAEIKTVTLLKSLGYQVTIIEWNPEEGKGIDDKIKNNGLKGFRYLPI